MKKMAFISALASCSGCSVLIQNRYSVLGIDGIQLDTYAEAKFWTLSMLGSVAVVSAALAALAFWLVQKWLRRRRGQDTSSTPPVSLAPAEPARREQEMAVPATAIANPALEEAFTTRTY